MWTFVESPIGPLRVVAQNEAVTSIEFDAPPASDGRPLGDGDDTDALLVEVRRQLEAYFAGQLQVFDLPLRPAGTTFQHRVWDQLGTRYEGEATPKEGAPARGGPHRAPGPGRGGPTRATPSPGAYRAPRGGGGAGWLAG